MPLSFDDSVFGGFIKANGRRYFVKGYIPDPSDWNAKNLTIDWRLDELLGPALNEFIESNCSCDFFTFFKKLENFIVTSLEQTKENDLFKTDPLSAYNMLMHLKEELLLVQDYIKDINLDEGVIELECTDAAARNHKAVLQINHNYPKEPVKIISHDLPIQEGSLIQKNMNFNSISTISGFCKKFLQCVECFQEFWNTVSMIDVNCWVLDPENPTFKDITRRVKINDRISVVLVFNPYSATNRPDIKFLGCHSNVTQLREILQKNLQNEVWNPMENILRNLMNVLEVTFPEKTETNKDTLDLVQEGECVICFLVRFENEIPSEICDNVNCLSQYHAHCLFKYLSSIPGNKIYFNRIQGQCPNCDEVISCPVPNLKLF